MRTFDFGHLDRKGSHSTCRGCHHHGLPLLGLSDFQHADIAGGANMRKDGESLIHRDELGDDLQTGELRVALKILLEPGQP